MVNENNILTQLDENPVVLPRTRGWLELLKAHDIEGFPCQDASKICLRREEANYVEALLELMLANERLKYVLDLVGDQKEVIIAQRNKIQKIIRVLRKKFKVIRKIWGSTMKRILEHKVAKNILISVGVIATVGIAIKILEPSLISLKNKIVKKKNKSVSKSTHVYT
jgi:hypothetical protein